MKEKVLSSKGRRRFGLGDRGRLIEVYERSGLTQRAFVEKHGLSLATLTNWLREHRQRVDEGSTREAVPGFHSVDLSRMIGGPSWAAEVVFADGTTLRLSSEAKLSLLQALLSTLRRPC
jgi:transposase-like protein